MINKQKGWKQPFNILKQDECETMVNHNTDFLQTNITTKLRFPSPMTKNYWAIEELSEKKLYAVPFVGALMVAACAKPITKSTLFEFLASKLNIQTEQFENALKNLISKNIILPSEKQEDYRPLFDNFLNWTKSGWEDAANYHFFTWDAPFLDYTKEGDGHDIDRKKMIKYQSLQPDTQRYKEYASPIKNIPLPSLDMPADQAQGYAISEKIKHLLAIAFGKKGEKPCHWIDDVPLIRRTSPSGGSRHPTEGYFLSIDLQGIQKGFYHIQTDPISLSLISEDKSSLLEDFVGKDSAKSVGAIVLTSVFERNMYRYREPRTFRTIHMDIGHILATIEMLAQEFGMKTRIHLNFNEEALLQKIGASMLDEGVMAVVTLHEEKC
ncbi:SagB/ThcOx family dehydrogenase [Candidatus Protochlamydia phocaeensis]|uniref:SagB/ThcOx family dehydrogenase n=1 Tax=Candidatus Protochlamydia phocaeensis TaxID=1414722 RepID=UPI00083922A0|nr:SagB/ThcOx family dehydrogenase [Candidatus Protochlamydia phocaeensis]